VVFLSFPADLFRLQRLQARDPPGKKRQIIRNGVFVNMNSRDYLTIT
jgi:hypothetical protein